MRIKKDSCPNGCKFGLRKKVLMEYSNHTWGYDYFSPVYCPVCGSLMPYSLKKIQQFFEIYHIHPKLGTAVRLLYKSEFESAAREAFVVVESVLRAKSGLDLHGFDLATKALKYEVDKKSGMLIKQPLIAINDLSTESKRNEQDGIRYMLMGFFQGMRNLYQHNHIGSGGTYSINAVLEASFFLDLLDGHSITDYGEWIESKVAYSDIYRNIPKLSDRIRFICMLKKKKRHLSKKGRMKRQYIG